MYHTCRFCGAAFSDVDDCPGGEHCGKCGQCRYDQHMLSMHPDYTEEHYEDPLGEES